VLPIFPCLEVALTHKRTGHGASKKLGPAGERVQEAKPFPLALAASSEGSNLTTANPPVPWPPAVDDRSSSPNEQVDIESQSSDFEDAVDMVFEKLRRKKQAMAAKHDANKATLLGELQQALGARNATEEELRTAQVKHKDLEVAAEKQRTEFAEFKSKATRLKTFVDGLGKDIDVLRRDRVTLQQKVVQLSAQAEEQHAKRDALLIDVSNMNSELVKVDRATRCKLVESTTLAIRLQHEVHEKTQLLTQERSLREGILGRLESLHEAAAVATDEIKSSNIGIRDKLCEIHAAVEARENEPGTSAVLESIATGVRGLDLKHVTAVQDVNTIKTMLETLSQR
jgi:chromosome segregation ATPase